MAQRLGFAIMLVLLVLEGGNATLKLRALHDAQAATW